MSPRRCAAALLLALAGGLACDPPRLEARHQALVAGAGDLAGSEGRVRVRALGNTNLLFGDGETWFLTDGWFTRPSTFSIALGEVEPDPAAIGAALGRAGVVSLAAVIPVHSHFDHAMDAPEVARRTGARLVGSESTANIGRGWGLAEEQILVAVPGERLAFGAFRVTLIESRHFAFPDLDLGVPDGGTATIDAPLVPPAGALDYAEGGSFSVLVEHPDLTALVQGSAGYLPGSLAGRDVDLLFLGVGGIAGQTPEYQDEYWRHVVEETRPERIVPVHFDSFTHELGDTWALPGWLWDSVFGLEATGGIDYAVERGAAAGIEVRLLPLWNEIPVGR